MTAVTEAGAGAAAAQQKQPLCHGGGGGGRRGGRGNGGNSSFGGDRGSGDNKGGGDNKGSGGDRGSGNVCGEYRVCCFHKFISYVASYVNPIQTAFLMTFQKSYGGTGIVFPLKKHHRSGKNRNPEDSSYRKYQARQTHTHYSFKVYLFTCW